MPITTRENNYIEHAAIIAVDFKEIDISLNDEIDSNDCNAKLFTGSWAFINGFNWLIERCLSSIGAQYYCFYLFYLKR